MYQGISTSLDNDNNKGLQASPRERQEFPFTIECLFTIYLLHNQNLHISMCTELIVKRSCQLNVNFNSVSQAVQENAEKLTRSLRAQQWARQQTLVFALNLGVLHESSLHEMSTLVLANL